MLLMKGTESKESNWKGEENGPISARMTSEQRMKVLSSIKNNPAISGGSGTANKELKDKL